ncbi:NAD(P)-binding protein [Eremomyces bilateralis CBS 781.70]|uniref:NAD(P)-binding protein n=1 Tax=Eremomyces bilateralis CBS 781.70 TaxID=1392243 RepID=A0A6G1GGK3_9PEZI|nr:NAD(P)-binding protein [Eremomyces bilateralis CBS 781.70]KAF1817122.1 NAD(P)-binding protein [Eremomyces bilateralis CBS 781.70]
MKAWQYSSAAGGLEKNLTLGDFPTPKPESLKNDQVLVKVLSVGLNPADYKVPEMAGAFRNIVGKPTVPSTDFAGRVAATHPTNDALKEGQLVFGRVDPMAFSGTLGEYTVAKLNSLATIPEGVDVDQASGIGTAAVTSYEAIAPFVKKGQKVFINGGSGGTGTYAIQISKALGLEVVTTCSAANIDLVKELGADEVLDYKAVDIYEELGKRGQVFDHVVDNIGDPKLYHCGDRYMKPAARFIQVGVPPNPVLSIASNTLLPSFLGGGKRPFKFYSIGPSIKASLELLGKWMGEGNLKSVIEQTYELEEAAEAFVKVRSGRTKGKVVVHVAKE